MTQATNKPLYRGIQLYFNGGAKLQVFAESPILENTWDIWQKHRAAGSDLVMVIHGYATPYPDQNTPLGVQCRVKEVIAMSLFSGEASLVMNP